MDWDTSLITLYLIICNAYEERLWLSCQRLTNGGYKRFSDQEAISIYLYGNLIGLKTLKQIHQYTNNHLKSYFPHLPGYEAFVHRIAFLGEAFNTDFYGRVNSHNSGNRSTKLSTQF